MYIKMIDDEIFAVSTDKMDEDYIYTTKYARGINPSTTIAVIAEIEEALGNLSSDKDREHYICTILRDLHEGYSAVEELYTNPKYKDLRECVGGCLDNKEDDNESEDNAKICGEVHFGGLFDLLHLCHLILSRARTCREVRKASREEQR